MTVVRPRSDRLTRLTTRAGSGRVVGLIVGVVASVVVGTGAVPARASTAQPVPTRSATQAAAVTPPSAPGQKLFLRYTATKRQNWECGSTAGCSPTDTLHITDNWTVRSLIPLASAQSPATGSAPVKVTESDYHESGYTRYPENPPVRCGSDPDALPVSFTDRTDDEVQVATHDSTMSVSAQTYQAGGGSFGANMAVTYGLTTRDDTRTFATVAPPICVTPAARVPVNGNQTGTAEMVFENQVIWRLPTTCTTTTGGESTCTTRVTNWGPPPPLDTTGILAEARYERTLDTYGITYTETFDLVGVAIEVTSATPDTGGNSYSIPDSGKANLKARTFLVAYTISPSYAKVDQVRVRLIDGAGSVLGQVYQEPPGSHTVAAGQNQLRVTVTFTQGATSTISTVPPPVETFRYAIRLEGRLGQYTATNEWKTGANTPLYTLPPGMPRYGLRDAGGDAWCTKSTYEWLDANRALVRPIDDISREHGLLFSPHVGHRDGKNIDEYHPAGSPPMSGGDYYRLLQSHASAAMASGGAADLAFLSNWVMLSRAHLSALGADPAVLRTIYMRGAEVVNPDGTDLLGEGWARDLLLSGTTEADGDTIDLGLGTWAGSKLTFDHVMGGPGMHTHDTHVHIQLR